ncbi:MAG: hypothetical protein QOH96_3783 [Blastocatellia bacterium]|nr:hypothetical protein [Blastocatellia bacterium]
MAIIVCAIPGVSAQTKITIDRNVGSEATPSFKFEHVPAPVKDNAAANAKIALIVGEGDGNGAGLKALIDGILPSSADSPGANFFFDAGTLGGRFRLDLGSSIEIAQINTYSWHPDTRGPQVYNLYASDGSSPDFNPAPDGNTHPVSCGWKLIASVDTRPKQGELGGQYGVSISDPGGMIGKYRYLLFDCGETETVDDFGNTFYSEVNVLVKK